MLKVGDKAPDFSLPDQNGQMITLSDLIKIAHVVIYFYPKDHTPGCTAESCSFRDNFEKFASLHTKIVGISADSTDSHNLFAKNNKLPFLLLSDTKGVARKLFGVGKTFGVLPGRATFIIDRLGIVRYAMSSQFNIQRHVDETLKAAHNL